MEEYDVVIIGAGIGGYTAAETAAKAGLKTAMVEKKWIGGTCLNYGCIPTKAYLHAAKQYQNLLHCGNFGMTVLAPWVDRERLYSYLQETVERLRNALTNRLVLQKITLYSGEAAIKGVGEIVICTDNENICIKAKHIILATGSCPVVLDIPGSNLHNVITSDQMFLKEHLLPSSIAVIGGGVIGIEAAFLFSQFGAQVTVIEKQERILGNLSEEMSRTVRRYLEEKGITVYTNTGLSRIEDADDELVVTVDQNGSSRKIVVEKVLLAIGRKANYNIDNIECTGIDTKDNKIAVNEHFETSVKGIFAIGDAVGRYQMAYTAAAEGVQVIRYILGETDSVDWQQVPQCVYITPEIAVIGDSETTAFQKGIDIQVGFAKMSANGKAVLENHSQGFIKLIIDKGKQCLIGAELFCENAVDILGILEVCIVNSIPARDLKKCIFLHPSYSESIKEALENAESGVV